MTAPSIEELDPTDLFDALEEGLCEGTPTISVQKGHVWIDDASFDARTVLGALLRALQAKGGGDHGD